MPHTSAQQKNELPMMHSWVTPNPLYYLHPKYLFWCPQVLWSQAMLAFLIVTMAILLTPLIHLNSPDFHLKTKTAIKKAFLFSLIPAYMILTHKIPPCTLSFNWLYSSSTTFMFSIQLDYYSMMFLPILLFVTWNIIEFSLWYMNDDPKMPVFFKYLLMFLIAMILFVLANNLYTLFIGWEGVGIMSFLLIGWYFSRSKAGTSAMQAILYNRIGDIGMLFSMFWLLSHFNSSNLEATTYTSHFTILLFGLIIAAASKSAQFGLHPWLASAMEGPTPVSALLHSSTMVVAGVFLLVRVHPIIENNQTALTMCLCLGAISTAFAAASALTQNDIKKIIAFSTSSQLGLMMLAIGLNTPNLAFIHICAHAFFKAMLFLCSGVIIHNLNGEQDIRKMGGLQKMLPITTSCMTIGSMALMGTPYLAGFYSKDAIIEAACSSNINTWALILTITATSFTAIYSLRIMFFASMCHPRSNPLFYINENNYLIINPIKRLAIGSIIAGMFIIQMFENPITPFILPSYLKMTALMASLLGVFFAMDLAKKSWTIPPMNLNITKMINTSFYHSTLHRMASAPTLDFAAKMSLQLIDMFWLQKIGPMGLTKLQLPPILKNQDFQQGLIKTYLSVSAVSAILFMALQLV
uniref:NADH-ubiquinone oxidoreductase chain 5 n=1 Tax=Eleutherodactylus atkinsi TaxID=448426 RepID=S4V151_9NEOB|nr:NADH dehydrogenase subunit 5 [Eleutherodactylus atkinsi]